MKQMNLAAIRGRPEVSEVFTKAMIDTIQAKKANKKSDAGCSG